MNIDIQVSDLKVDAKNGKELVALEQSEDRITSFRAKVARRSLCVRVQSFLMDKHMLRERLIGIPGVHASLVSEFLDNGAPETVYVKKDGKEFHFAIGEVDVPVKIHDGEIMTKRVSIKLIESE